ncbi:MAG: hypothetical protein PHT69_13470 [Bacteroidales bacterium]|nr:hypothetical protein [Bacteroidales bacterium]
MLTICMIISSIIFSQNTSNNAIDYSTFNPLNYSGGIRSIKVYIMAGCHRCEQVIDSLNIHNINYTEIKSENTELFSDMDSRIYFSIKDHSVGYSINYPVIELNTDLYYKITDYNTFVKNLKMFLAYN